MGRASGRDSARKRAQPRPSRRVALRKLRGEAPVRLIWYPGEGHGNRNAGARYDYSLRQLRWMEHYLMGAGGEKPPFEIEYPLEKKEPTRVSALPQ